MKSFNNENPANRIVIAKEGEEEPRISLEHSRNMAILGINNLDKEEHGDQNRYQVQE